MKKGARSKKAASKAAKSRRSKKRPAKRITKASSSTRGRKARGGLGGVRKAGKRTWQRLKKRTAQVVEGVKERIVG